MEEYRILDGWVRIKEVPQMRPHSFRNGDKLYMGLRIINFVPKSLGEEFAKDFKAASGLSNNACP